MKNEKITEKNEIVEVPTYGYYSRLLNRPFDTVEELQAAEAEVRKAEEEKKQLAEVKKSRATEIEEAYKDYLDVRKQAKEIIAEAQEKAAALIKEAENKYYELRTKFIEDYGSYHVSTYSDGTKEIVKVSDLFDSIFKSFWF